MNRRSHILRVALLSAVLAFATSAMAQNPTSVVVGPMKPVVTPVQTFIPVDPVPVHPVVGPIKPVVVPVKPTGILPIIKGGGPGPVVIKPCPTCLPPNTVHKTSVLSPEVTTEVMPTTSSSVTTTAATTTTTAPTPAPTGMVKAAVGIPAATVAVGAAPVSAGAAAAALPAYQWSPVDGWTPTPQNN